MSRLAMLLVVTACSSDSAPPPSDAGIPVHRLDRACITGVLSGELLPNMIGDELFVASGCERHDTEGFWLERTEFLSLGPACCNFTFYIDLVRFQSDGPIAIHQNRLALMRFFPGLPTTEFSHYLDDAWFFDINGDGVRDYVTIAEGAIQRAPEQGGLHTYVDPSIEIALIAGKPFRVAAVADLGGSPLPDLFYATTEGELGIAIQTAPDVFDLEVVGSDPGTPLRMGVGDVDGDGVADVVGAAGHVFVYSSKRHAVTILDESAQAIGVGDLDILDGHHDAIYLTANHHEVRRVIVAEDGTLSSVRLLDVGGDAMTLGDIDGDYVTDIALVHDIGQPTSWVDLWRGFYLR